MNLLSTGQHLYPCDLVIHPVVGLACYFGSVFTQRMATSLLQESLDLYCTFEADWLEVAAEAK